MTRWEDLFTGPPSRLSAPQDGGVPIASRTGRVGCPDTTRADPWQQWWTFTRETARAIRANTAILPVLDIYGPVLADDEAALLSAELTYSRFYGADGSYQRSDLFVVGHPAVMIGSLAVNAALNARRKAAARAAATPRWQSHRTCQVIATTQRLICANPTRGFLSFYYAAVTEFHPDLHTWTVTLGFGDQCSPLRLYGPPTPALSLWAAVAIEGHRWHTDPRLAPILT